MKKVQGVLLLSMLLILGACSNESKKEVEPETKEEQVGFSLTGDSIEEAQNIPEDEKKEILQAFDTYITMFNEKKWDEYIAMISENSESLDKEEERAYIETFFADYDLVRDPSNITIVKYAEDEAQVFSNLEHTQTQLDSGLEVKEKARQVTVFTKESGEWKVNSVHTIGDNLSQN